MSETYSARLFFQTEFLSLLQNLAQLDVRLRKLDRSQPSHFRDKVLSTGLIQYLMDVSSLLKDRVEIRQKIQNFFL